MALSKIDAANFLTGTIPSGNIATSSLSAAATGSWIKLAETNVTTSTYGLGYQFNEELMVSMAGSGLGHSYYGQTSNDLMDPFTEEFETLVNTVASQIKVKSENQIYS